MLAAGLRRGLAVLGVLAAQFPAYGTSRAQDPPGAAPEARTTWTSDRRPTRQALAVLEYLRNVEAQGLRPADYDTEALSARAAALTRGGPADSLELARFDAALSGSLVRLLAHLHAGRVAPRTLAFDLPDSHRGLDLAAMALATSQSADVPAAIAAAEPPYAGYKALKRALARYRALAAGPALRLPSPAGGSVHPGVAYAGTPTLRRLLVASGDLRPETAAAADPDAAERYDDSLVSAVVDFQQRHALRPDGVLGPATMAQLRVTPAARIRQIELTLERWRWLPDAPPPRFLVVNIPAFRLYAFENDPEAERPLLRMNVIVGRAQGRHGTPVFAGTMRQVVFRPYWDVPPSIARGEIIPAARRELGYMVREGLEIVRGSDDGATIYPPSGENLARVAAGTLRLRQRPGPRNPLGAVKFDFPNSYNVYLHGTPQRELFAAPRRDFSHGCIRVEDPTSLAEFALAGQAPWDHAAIQTAMEGARTQRVTLERPVAVYILYGTAVVGPDQRVHFYPDLYGHDAALARALERQRRAPPAASADSPASTIRQ